MCSYKTDTKLNEEHTAMDNLSNEPVKKYKAFISYSHSNNQGEGRKWADWLHHALETYEIPEELIGKKNARGEEIPRQIYPVFQDEKELSASSNLNSSLTDALDRSEFLIYLSSPMSANSTYVRDEIRYFKQTGKSKQIIALILSGEPEYGDTHTELQCFPDELRYNIDADGKVIYDQPEEVLAADVRIPHSPEEGYTSAEAYRRQLHQEGKSAHEIKLAVEEYKKRLDLAQLKIIAGILGVPLGELTKRDQAYQLQKIKQKNKNIKRIATAIGAMAILAIIAGIVAWNQKNSALRNLARSLYASGINKLTESEYGDGAAYIAEATRRGDESAKLFAHSMLAVQDDLTVMPNAVPGNARFSPDGLWLANFADVGSNKNVLQIWDAKQRKMHKQLSEVSSTQTRPAQFDAKNRVYVTAGPNNIIRYDIENDKTETIRANPDSVFLSLKAVSPSGKYLVYEQARQAILFDIDSKQEIPLHAMDNLSHSIAYVAPNDRSLVFAVVFPEHTQVYGFDLQQRPLKPSFSSPLSSSMRNPAFSSSGLQVLINNLQGLHYFDMASGRQWQVSPGINSYRYAGINKNGTIAAGNDSNIDLYNANGQKQKSTPLPKNLFFLSDLTKILVEDPMDMDYHSADWTQELVNANPLTFIKNSKSDPLKLNQFYGDANFLSAIPGLTDEYIFVLNRNSATVDRLTIETGEIQKGFAKINGTISFFHLLPTSKILIVKDKTNKTHAFDAETGKPIGKPFDSQVKQYVFNAAQTQVLARTGANSFGIWELRSGKQLVDFKRDSPLGGFTANPDFSSILEVGDTSWRIIDVKSKKVIKEVAGKLSSGLFNQQGTYLAIVESTGKARVLDSKNFKQLLEIPTIEFPFMVFNHQGNVLAISEDANHMRLWDLEEKKSFGQTIRISKYSQYFQFSKDDKQIFVQDDAGTFSFAAKLLDAKTGNVLTMPFINKKFDFIYVLPGDEKILTLEGLMEGKAISIWEVPGHVETSKEQLADDLEKFYGKKYDSETGAILNYTGGQKDYSTWYFQDPATRTVSPSSTVRIVDLINKHNPIKTAADLQLLAVTYAKHPLARAILANHFSEQPETRFIGQRFYEITQLQLPKINDKSLKQAVEAQLKTAAQKLNQ